MMCFILHPKCNNNLDTIPWMVQAMLEWGWFNLNDVHRANEMPSTRFACKIVLSSIVIRKSLLYNTCKEVLWV